MGSFIYYAVFWVRKSSSLGHDFFNKKNAIKCSVTISRQLKKRWFWYVIYELLVMEFMTADGVYFSCTFKKYNSDFDF